MDVEKLVPFSNSKNTQGFNFIQNLKSFILKNDKKAKPNVLTKSTMILLCGTISEHAFIKKKMTKSIKKHMKMFVFLTQYKAM